MASTKVLSIDGGGIRGVVPAMLLTEIENRTQKPIAKLFDLIAGTSTGGILALGLTKPGNDGQPTYRARDMVALYETEGPIIFSRTVWHRMRAIAAVEEKYPAQGIESVLEKYFKEARLKDALTPVLVTSYEIEQRLPFFFRSAKAKNNPEFDFLMKQVARATSAAPTYFEPFQLQTAGLSGSYALIDGGVFANNPALCAFIEAKNLSNQADDCLLVSLGTGELTRSFPYEEAKDWGLLRWAQPLLSILFQGVSATVDYQMKQLLPMKGGIRRYYRFQPVLEMGNDDMDDAGTTNLHALKSLAARIIREREEDLNALCEQLVR